VEIVVYPDPVLRKQCRALTEEEIKTGVIDGKPIKELVAEMTRLMREAPGHGVGLAAPQIGIPIRLFIVDIALSSPNAIPLVFINPEISDPHGEEEQVEGCLSLPGVHLKVKRAQTVKVKARNIEGIEFDFEAKGGMARCVQHENDHCFGTMIIQKASLIANIPVRRALQKLEDSWARRQARLAKKKTDATINIENSKH